MNSFTFIGNIGSVKELRYTPNGKAVLSFSVAVTSGYGDAKKTSWANCTLWGKQAEGLAQYIHKGERIGIVGEITLREWTSDSKSGTSLDVNVRDVTLLGEKHEGASPVSGDFDDHDFTDF